MRLKTGRRPQKRRKRPQKGGEQCAVPSKMAAIASSEKCEPCSTHKSELFRASLGLNDVIVDILITLGKQYHIIRPSSRKEGVFIYFVLDKNKSNLAMARRKTMDADKELNF